MYIRLRIALPELQCCRIVVVDVGSMQIVPMATGCIHSIVSDGIVCLLPLLTYGQNMYKKGRKDSTHRRPFVHAVRLVFHSALFMERGNRYDSLMDHSISEASMG